MPRKSIPILVSTKKASIGLTTLAEAVRRVLAPYPGMKPTFQLRWREASPSEERDEPCTVIPRSWMDERFILEQLWKDDSGKSEWRAVAIERAAVATVRT